MISLDDLPFENIKNLIFLIIFTVDVNNDFLSVLLLRVLRNSLKVKKTSVKNSRFAAAGEVKKSELIFSRKII